MATKAVQLQIACPAGERVDETLRGLACRCRIVHETIREGESERSLTAFCTASPTAPRAHDDRPATSYLDCPIWQRHKRAEANGTARELQREIDADVPTALPVLL